MKNTYYFWIRRTHGSNLEKISIEATDSHEAVSKLPKCVSWDFSDG